MGRYREICNVFHQRVVQPFSVAAKEQRLADKVRQTLQVKGQK